MGTKKIHVGGDGCPSFLSNVGWRELVAGFLDGEGLRRSRRSRYESLSGGGRRGKEGAAQTRERRWWCAIHPQENDDAPSSVLLLELTT